MGWNGSPSRIQSAHTGVIIKGGTMKNNSVVSYQLLKDSYEGSGGFVDGRYLTKHPREIDEKYLQRKQLAYYLNYIKPCVDAHVSPIFKSLAVREYSGPGSAAWERFAENVDFTGKILADLMKQSACAAKLYGVAFIVMDREQATNINTVQKLEDDRSALPYAFLVEPLRVEEVLLDKFGRIIKFVYAEPDEYEENKNAIRELTIKGWKLKNSKGEREGSWDLGCVPVVPLYAKYHDPFNPFPASDFLSIAQTNLAIYNMSSWLSDIFVNQTFSILVYPSNHMDDLTIGTSNALGFPPEAAHDPKFISPDAAPATILSETINRLQQECYRMASVVNVTGVRAQSSGVAKAWDFEQTNQILSAFADCIEAAEIRLADLFARFTGAELHYMVNYPNDFSIADVETELANAEVAKGLNFGDEFNIEVFKRVLTSYLPELDDKDFDGLVEAYKQNVAQQKVDLQSQTTSGESE